MTAEPQSVLNRLAAALGVESSYCDIWGNRRETSAETAAQLVAAMGFPAGDETTAARSWAAWVERTWAASPTPAVVTAAVGSNALIPLRLPRGTAGDVSWTLRLENGAGRRGKASLASLVVAETFTATAVAGDQTTAVAGDGTTATVCDLSVLPLPADLPAGYHRLKLTVAACKTTVETTLIVAPERCLTVDEALGAGARTWGVAAQLYALRSDADWGVGDFSSLGRLAEIAAGQGADLLGLNPLHALFPADPQHCSPYSPSNRAFLNVLYIDATAVPEYADCPAAQQKVANPAFLERLAAAREAEQVDYPAVAALKLPVLAELHAHFVDLAEYADDNPRAVAYRAFCDEAGEDLRRHALFDALHEHFFDGGRGPWRWRDWPEPYRDAASPETAAFAEEHAARVDFFQWMQFEADRQLGVAAERARAAGMRIGFYRDLAVGADSGGSAAWSDPGAPATGAAVGAPPDLLNLVGQNWGLTPPSPPALRDRAYAPFISALRANMRHAGALRIDHVMGLMHMFWLPDGGAPGAYVEYPFDDLLRIVALESHRNRCLVIGEDLGTVPDGFRPRMAEAGVLSYRVLYFERDKTSGDFLPPAAYPAEALATVTTHDLAPLRGFWTGRDLEWRRLLNLYPSDDMRGADEWDRGVDRWRLLRALDEAGLRPDSYPDNEGGQAWTPDLSAAVYAFSASSPAALLTAALEDVLEETDQPNLPGTVDQHPNWRRRATVNLKALAGHPGMRRLAAVCNARKTSPPAPATVIVGA